MPIKARNTFNITGRGIVVVVGVKETDQVQVGDTVTFTVTHGNSFVNESATYRVTGIEESRCLVDHKGQGQCVTDRGLVVRALNHDEQQEET